jgi:hypothetical protein
MDATGIGTGHNDSFVYQARAFLDEVAGRDELPRNASFADGLHALLLEEAVVRTATQNSPKAAPHPSRSALQARRRGGQPPMSIV